MAVDRAVGNAHASRWETLAHLHLALLLKQFVESAQPGATTHNHYSPRQVSCRKTGVVNLCHNVGCNLVGAGMDIVVDFCIVNSFGEALGAARGVGREGIAVYFLDFLGALLEIVEGDEVEGDVSRTHGERGQIYRRSAAVDGHSSGLGAEVHEHASKPALVVGKHHRGLGQRQGDVIADIEPQAFGHDPSEHPLELGITAYHGKTGAHHVAERPHRVGYALVVHSEAYGNHVDHVAVGAHGGSRLHTQLLDHRVGDFRLAGHRYRHLGHRADQRAAAERHIHTRYFPGRDGGIGLQAFEHVGCGCGHLHVLDAPVAHLVDYLVFFHGHDIDHAEIVDYADCGAHFRAAYFQCHDVAFVVSFSHNEDM